MTATAAPVVIVGAGIAGLTTALALARTGCRALVLERAAALSEVGAGLQLSPNATRILLHLGLGDALAVRASAPEAIVVREARQGATLVRLPLGDVARRQGAPYWVIHRADLQSVLLDAVGREPAVELRLGVQIGRIETTASAVSVETTRGSVRETVTGPVLIGADGVRSAVRRTALGGGPAVYSGRTAYRATVEAARCTGLPDIAATTGLWLGPRAHLVHYPVKGGRHVNVVAAVDDAWTGEGWDQPAALADLQPVFRDWPEPARALIAAPDQWRRWALSAAPDGTPFARGRIALVGDAAHGMLPFVAQGGAMAIEDAAVLARHLAGAADPVAALAAYGRDRAPRTARVVATARRNAVVYHLAGLPATARDLAIRLAGPAGLAASMVWIWGWRDAA